MRVLRLALAGGLVLTAPIAVQASPPGSNMGRAEVDRATGIERVGNGNGPGYHPMPNGWNGDWPVGLLSGAGGAHVLGLGSQRRGL